MNVINLTLSSYALGTAVFVLFADMLTARYGRRPIILFSLIIFTLSALLISVSPWIWGDNISQNNAVCRTRTLYYGKQYGYQKHNDRERTNKGNRFDFKRPCPLSCHITCYRSGLYTSGSALFVFASYSRDDNFRSNSYERGQRSGQYYDTGNYN
ncbi:MAG TPA: hypothetical protein DD381_07935 [Lentisphaeria bacterium]|nr:hypothetical protein [Lentisphaeria bacterium]